MWDPLEGRRSLGVGSRGYDVPCFSKFSRISGWGSHEVSSSIPANTHIRDVQLKYIGPIFMI